MRVETAGLCCLGRKADSCCYLRIAEHNLRHRGGGVDATVLCVV